MALWQSGNDYTYYGFSGWPLSLSPLAHQQLRDLSVAPVALADAEPLSILDFVRQPESAAELPPLSLDLDRTVSAEPPSDFTEAPPLSSRFFASVGPEVAERWLDRALASEIYPAAQLAYPPSALSADIHDVPDLAACQPVPAPEPVSAWIGLAACTEPAAFAGNTLALPAMDLVPDNDIVPDLAGFQLAPQAEPAAAWLTVAAELVAFPAAAAVVLPMLDLVPDNDITPDLAGFQPMSAAEPVAAWLAPALELVALDARSAFALPVANALAIGSPEPTASNLAADDLSAQVPAASQPDFYSVPAASAGIYAPVLPELTLEAELEPLPDLDELLEPPALCERLLPTPAAEPVWNFLEVASAGAIHGELPQARPVFAGEIGPVYVPMAHSPRRAPGPEPVMAGVWPRVAETTINSIDTVPGFHLPTIAPAPAALRTPLAAPAAAPQAEPVERLMVASHAAQPVEIDPGVLPIQLPGMAAFSAVAPVGALGPTMAASLPEAAAAWVAAATASESLEALPVALLPFEMEAGQTPSITPAEHPPLAPAAAEPAAAEGGVLELKPVATIRVALPKQQYERPLPVVPKPGLVAIEYHMQRTRSVSFERPEWKTSRYEPIPPAFTLRAVLDNPEDLIKPKPDYAGVFPINAGRSARTRSAIMEHVLRVAAAVLIVTSIWVGAAALKSARRVTVHQEETAFATPDRVLTPSQQADKAKAAEAKGPLNWVKKSIANRASVQVAEDFQQGMQKWGAETGGLAPNWRRNASAGYVQTGALALLNPTRTFTDYKLEFFGQIESKSIGWVVRAKDDKNYHAMKFNMVEQGLRPIIAITHYNVVDGKMGRAISSPLNVMVHNNKPFQVAVTVKGKRFVTEVDGEQVDTFSEDLLAVGGVGFFSDPGERARLYWARVTKNDDWIGHFCAFLSGGDTQSTAELWTPAVPGIPTPWSPAGDSPILAAAWVGLPPFRRTHSPRRHKRCNK